MVLYCIQHPANILKAIIHKFKYHDDEEAVIFTDMTANSPFCPCIDSVKYYKMPDVNKIVTYNSDSKKDVIQNAETTIDKFLEENNIFLTDFSAIYALYDMYNPFTLYCELKGISYACVESTNNTFNHYWMGNFVNDRTKECFAYNSLIKEMHLQDGQGAHCVKGYLFSDESVYPNGGSVPAEVFGYYETMLSLDTRHKEQLIKVFELNKYTFDSILLFNSPGLTGKLIQNNGLDIPVKEKLHDVFFFYKVIIDYYFSNVDFILKLHPASGHNFFNAFSDFKQVPMHIPVELFALTEKKFKVLCPLQSTSINLFRQMGYEVVFFSGAIMRFFKLIHFAYDAFSLIKSVGIPEKIAVYGIDLSQLEYFKTWSYTDFKNVRFVQLTIDNARDAKYIIADPDNKFEDIIKNAGNDCLIIANGDCEPKSGFRSQIMTRFVSDIAKTKRFEPQKSDWTVLSKDDTVLSAAKDFCHYYTLKNAEIKILSLSLTDFVNISDPKNTSKNTLATAEKKNTQEIAKSPTQEASDDKLKLRERSLLTYHRYMQMYYESEIAGYSLRDYFEEIGLLSPQKKLAFFATDELGVMVYRICERCGIKFSALVSDTDREIRYKTHDNFTESLKLQSLSKVDKSSYASVFMATVWNGEQIDFVKSFSPGLFLFDAVVQAMYTRAFFLNKIAEIAEKNPKVKVGVFFLPYIKQIPGEHSELEQFFSRQGANMPNVLHIKDEAMREKAKELCYKVYGFDDEYIENVCNASYPIISYDGVYMFPDFESKYANVVNHRRATTDNPKDFTNTVYLFGDSCVTGLSVGDSETIASNLQRIINNNSLPYSVQNCANTFGGHYDWIFTLTDTMKFKAGDILLFCARIDWMTEQYIKENNKKMLNNIFGIYTTPVFQRPHDHGEIFVDDHHFNDKGNNLIAQKIFDDIKNEKFFEHADESFGETTSDNVSAYTPNPEKDKINRNGELSAYIDEISQYRVKIGSIVMNCNPFTLGHRYLIEYAAGKVDKLYVFVVEEDKSEFPFSDRLELVKKGTQDLSDVVVIPSGKFIISTQTFQQYFEKGENQNVVVDASNDLEIFAKEIAPSLNITVRFAGEEPLDNVTRQYNASMRSILPQYGIEFEEIPRKEHAGEVISASRVRKLLKAKDFAQIEKLVPATTFEYLKKIYGESE